MDLTEKGLKKKNIIVNMNSYIFNKNPFIRYRYPVPVPNFGRNRYGTQGTETVPASKNTGKEQDIDRMFTNQ